MRFCLVFLSLLPCTFLLDTDAIKINTGIRAHDISKTLQFVWDALIRWYKQRIPDRDPPGKNSHSFHFRVCKHPVGTANCLGCSLISRLYWSNRLDVQHTSSSLASSITLFLSQVHRSEVSHLCSDSL